MIERFLADIDWWPIFWGVVLGVAVVGGYLLLMKFLEK